MHIAQRNRYQNYRHTIYTYVDIVTVGAGMFRRYFPLDLHIQVFSDLFHQCIHLFIDNRAHAQHRTFTELDFTGVSRISFGSITYPCYINDHSAAGIRTAGGIVSTSAGCFFTNGGTLDDYIEQIYDDRPQFITTIKNLFFFRYTTPEFDKWFEDLCLQASGWATAKSLISLRDERLFDDLKAINIPTLILHGIHDKVCPFDLATYLNKNIKDSVLIPLKESGHAAFFEEKDEVSDAIDKFIRKELAKNK